MDDLGDVGNIGMVGILASIGSLLVPIGPLLAPIDTLVAPIEPHWYHLPPPVDPIGAHCSPNAIPKNLRFPWDFDAFWTCFGRRGFPWAPIGSHVAPLGASLWTHPFLLTF